MELLVFLSRYVQPLLAFVGLLFLLTWVAKLVWAKSTDRAGKSFQLASNLTHPAFGEVNLRYERASVNVSLTLLMEPDIEGMQTALALDGSSSMRGAYGQLRKSPPREVIQDLQRRGLIKEMNHDGKRMYRPSSEAIEELKATGSWYGRSENVMEPQAQEMAAYLARKVDAAGRTLVLYWACGNGSQLESPVVLRETDCKFHAFDGPQNFGRGTFLYPAMKYFVDRFSSAKYSFFVFLTDGELDDLEKVKSYTTKLARDIHFGRREMVKCVLVGVGEKINVSQLLELDDLETGTDVDIWDHKVADEMRNLLDIFAEVVDSNMIVAPEGKIFDSNHRLVHHFQHGLPAAFEFKLPAGSTFFQLLVNGNTIQQNLPPRSS